MTIRPYIAGNVTVPGGGAECLSSFSYEEELCQYLARNMSPNIFGFRAARSTKKVEKTKNKYQVHA